MTRDDESVAHVYTMKVYSAIKNDITKTSGKWIKLEKNYNYKPGSERQLLCVLSYLGFITADM